MNKIFRKIKKIYKKYKYMDRTKARFFMVTTVISLFCLFVGGTHAYFNIIEYLDSSIITIARLKYQLTSTNTNFKNSSITVGAGETLELTLDLKSLNPEHTKYALNYSSDSSDVKVYYDEKREQNVLGEIGGLNSIINIKVVIKNNSTSNQTVNFELKGGYLQNTLACNITEEYIKKIIVTFDANGGTVSTTEKEIELDASIYGELPIPEYAENIFLGWFTESSGGIKITSNSEINDKNNITLYAHWKYPEFIQLLSIAVANKNKVPEDSILKNGSPNFDKISPTVLTYKDNNFRDDITVKVDSYINDYFIYSDSYTFDIKTGTYTLSNPKTCKYSESYDILREKYVLSPWGNSNSSFTQNDYTNRAYIYKIIDTTASTLKCIKSSVSGDTFDYSEDGIFSMEDDLGMSYYFRGNIRNNYVKFGDFYWRIIRINGDGSVRIIYDGTNAHENGETSADRIAFSTAWNITNLDDAKYIGYMYGGENGTASENRIELGMEGYEDSLNAIYNETNSNMKTKLEEWYVTNIENQNLDKFLVDQIFCNDRSLDSGTGFGSKSSFFGASDRLGKPTLKCPNKNDAFTTIESEKGNGKLSKKVGLLSFDEANVSGGFSTQNLDYYLYKGKDYWLGSPYYFWSYNNMFGLSSNGSIYNEFTVDSASPGVAPVISLTPEYFKTLIGDGTASNPYRAPDVEP